MLKESQRLADDLGGLFNSITDGKGNRAGILGELALAAHLGAARADKRGFDLVLDGKTIEVKTKRRTVTPRGFYEGSVAITSGHQKPDFYAFLSLTFEEKRVIKGNEFYAGLTSIWFCGIISYEDFIIKSKFLKKGQHDGSNKFIVKADMRNIAYDKLDMVF